MDTSVFSHLWASNMFITRAMFNHLDEDGRRTTPKDRTAAVLKQIGEKTTLLGGGGLWSCYCCRRSRGILAGGST